MKARLQNLIHTSLAKHHKQVINHLLANPQGRVARIVAPVVPEARRHGAPCTTGLSAVTGCAGPKPAAVRPVAAWQKQVINQLLANPNARRPTAAPPVVAETHRVARQHLLNATAANDAQASRVRQGR